MALEIGLSSMLTTVYLVLYALIGAIAAMIYGLRKIFSLEKRIITMDSKIARLLSKVEKEERKELSLLKKKRKR